ncbi:DUF6461 domain-containing protein [Spirilliplanes yamanashiensis]|uniref:Uncharacterized protein n=1 Tax=Spirilliplanes yamanashiensis TaxID=42233 RepID=A0A8J4DJ27_9ACTN|nr:DUF6461 domain-containing protein [Spirilliplanes yamanashiensis]MDP9817002.1 hypothetical protein [Spirilliplanes yamanashiensis]GIJ03341.1 hypothetical protein Sya03_26930 [Spirilliplanes yamanashiensis]
MSYAWFTDRCAALAEAYCLTLVAGLSPREVIDRLDGTGVRPATGLAAVLEPAPGDEEFVAVTQLPGWSLIVEPYGYLGVTEDVYGPLSAGSELVAHYRNIVGGDQFVHVADGVVLRDLSPTAEFPAAPVEGALELAGKLTGVRLTAELLESAEYLCADVPEPL